MLPLPRIDLARADELSSIAAMRVAEGWESETWLLPLLHAWDGARIFVVRDQGVEPLDAARAHAYGPFLAAAVVVDYGSLGFIGNVVVRHDMRGRGLGRAVMEAALRWLQERGTPVVELDATERGRPLYRRLGFVGSEHSWALWTPIEGVPVEAAAAIGAGYACAALPQDDVQAVADLDHRALGGERTQLLRAVLGLPDVYAYLARDGDGEVAGYALLRPLGGHARGLHLGPWVAREPGAAAALLAHGVRAARRTLPEATVGRLHATIPGASRPALDLCTLLGLTLIEDDQRMRLELAGSPSQTAAPHEPERAWTYAMLAQMVG